MRYGIKHIVMCCGLLACGPLAAQTIQATTATGAELRVLDKLSGIVTDVNLQSGQSRTVGYLKVTMNECRVPSNNPTGDAFAELTVQYRDDPAPVFAGWLVASAPALNAMDHPRYDVWVMRCTNS